MEDKVADTKAVNDANGKQTDEIAHAKRRRNYKKELDAAQDELIRLKDQLLRKAAEFDPNLHEALLTMERDGNPTNVVIEEYVKGYKINDKVIRHSQVVVSK